MGSQRVEYNLATEQMRHPGINDWLTKEIFNKWNLPYLIFQCEKILVAWRIFFNRLMNCLWSCVRFIIRRNQFKHIFSYIQLFVPQTNSWKEQGCQWDLEDTFISFVTKSTRDTVCLTLKGPRVRPQNTQQVPVLVEGVQSTLIFEYYL